jgi:hypothetical protein
VLSRTLLRDIVCDLLYRAREAVPSSDLEPWRAAYRGSGRSDRGARRDTSGGFGVLIAEASTILAEARVVLIGNISTILAEVSVVSMGSLARYLCRSGCFDSKAQQDTCGDSGCYSQRAQHHTSRMAVVIVEDYVTISAKLKVVMMEELGMKVTACRS